MSDFWWGVVGGVLLASAAWMWMIKSFFSQPKNAVWLSHLLRKKGY